MKTVSAALLLLVSICCCAAMPRALNQISPGSCCFKFFTGRVPLKQIVSIAETHSSCQERGLVISTAGGKEICVSHHVVWARDTFKNLQVLQD
ncbi:C-C motif chemokine 4 homolog [Clinocottus analis]|uniref:C-C motif chemokine 4 homolog n=1 Tax=Clinocottus analis TaxID=304258 RepID=UPI0035C0060A